MGSVWGEHLKISLFGESHGKAIGVVIDNFPAGVFYDEDFIISQLFRRATGKNFTTTARKESDIPVILSGVYNGYTTGAPISAVIFNEDTKSNDYKNLSDIPRPSHADYTGQVRYNGYNDPRGGGHFSARLTAMLTFAGALCQLYLRDNGITIGSHISSIADVNDTPFDMVNVTKSELELLKSKEFNVIDDDKLSLMLDKIRTVKDDCNSVGGTIECAVIGVPSGVGNPIFGAVESRISSMIFSIPAVKGVEFGSGFDISKLYGDEANDLMYLCEEDKSVKTKTNHNGGVVGGITNSMPIIIKTALKPTPSIAKPQQTLNLKTNTIDTLHIHGRHDPCVVTRAGVVIECGVAVAVTDMILEAKTYGKSITD